jgi:hypothetical protein
VKSGVSPTAQRRWSLFGIGALALLPCLAVVLSIHRYGGFLPIADQWSVPGGLFEARFYGELRLEHFFRQHNEARKAFTGAVWMLLASNGWSMRLEMYVSVLLAAAGLISYLSICRWCSPGSRLAPALISATASVVLFNPIGLIGGAAWLWGVNMENAIVIAALLGGVCANLYLRSWPQRYAISAAFSVAATYSFANGMLLWLLIYPRLFRVRDDEVSAPLRRALWLDVVYLAGFAIVVGSYFNGYHRPAQHPSILAALSRPDQVLDFFFTWLGAPLSPRIGTLTFQWGIGLVGVGLYSLCLVEVVRHRLWSRALPFFLLATYTLVSGVAVSLGRAAFGASTATASRYFMHVVVFYLGVNGLLWLCATATRGERRRLVHGSMFWAILALQVAFVTSNWVDIVPKHLRGFHERNRRGEAALQFLDLIPDNPDLTILDGYMLSQLRRFKVLLADDVLSVDLAPTSDELVVSSTVVDQSASLFISTQADQVRVFGSLVDGPGIEGHSFLLLHARARAEGKFVSVLPLDVYPRERGANRRRIDALISTDNIGLGLHELELFGYDPTTRECASLGVFAELRLGDIAPSEILDATALELRPQAGMFTIDTVNGVSTVDRSEFTIPRGSPLVITGWAFDAESDAPAARIYVKWGERLIPARYRGLRPDVAQGRARPDFMTTGFNSVLDESMLGGETSGTVKFVLETRRGEYLEDPQSLTIERADP